MGHSNKTMKYVMYPMKIVVLFLTWWVEFHLRKALGKGSGICNVTVKKLYFIMYIVKKTNLFEFIAM